MDWRNYSDLIVVGLIGLVGTFGVLYAEEFVFQHNAWCISGETHCVREWVSALGGWAATLVAALTGYFIVGQFREARAQTRFLVGDALPTIDIHPQMVEPNAPEIVVTVTNWNRRNVVVDSCRVAGREGAFKPHFRSVVEKRWVDGWRHEAIPGWRNRNEPAPTVRFGFNSNLALQIIAIEVDLTITGDSHKRVVLTASTADLYEWYRQRSDES